MITTLKTAPTVTPITVAEAATHLFVLDELEHDTYIETLVDTATAWVEQYLQCRLITQTWYAYYDTFPAGPLNVPFGTLQSITSVKYTDVDDVESTFAASSYDVDTNSIPGRIVLKDGEVWPTDTMRPMNPIVIEFVTGYGLAASVPTPIKHAMKMLIGHWFENREDVIVSSMQAQEMPGAVRSLLNPFRVWRWVV